MATLTLHRNIWWPQPDLTRSSASDESTQHKNHKTEESMFGYFSENLGLFQFVSVCYETVLFVSIVSIKVWNTETNQKF